MGARKLLEHSHIIINDMGYTIELIEDTDSRAYDDPPELWEEMVNDGVIAAAGTVLHDRRLVLIRKSLDEERKASVLAHELAHLYGMDEWEAIDMECTLCKIYGFKYPF
jgi:hypothetical protein